MITVKEVVESAFPAGTQIVAGKPSIGREATWATRPKPSPPAFDHLKGGEIVLLSGSALSSVDERMSLETAVRELASLKVAGIAFVGTVTPAARSAADETGVAFIKLPEGADLGTLEREASHLITVRRRDAQWRGQEAGRRLLELAIAGESLPSILRELSELGESPIVLENRDGRLVAFAAGESDLARSSAESILAAERDPAALWLRTTGEGSPAEPPVKTFSLTGGWSRVVAPVIGREGLLGNLSMLVSGRAATSADEMLTSRGAAACAVVMAQEYATLAARREIEINVLDEVLDGALRSEVSLLQQAKRLGHDLQQSHVVIVARRDSIQQTSIARTRDSRWPAIEEVAARRGTRILWRVRNNNAEYLWPCAEAADARLIAASIHEELNRQVTDPTQRVAVGIGRVRAGLNGIQISHQEAKHALAMGRRLNGAGGLTRFEDLGVYRLIFAAEQLPELRAFHDEALNLLMEYDNDHGGELIPTLKAFFDAKCGPKEAAGMLNVHRNTVLYRLQRIREITGLDLDDADVRLRLHLALCIHFAVYHKEE